MVQNPREYPVRCLDHQIRLKAVDSKGKSSIRNDMAIAADGTLTFTKKNHSQVDTIGERSDQAVEMT